MRTSAFEILGPIMVGPSSSHTAGALRVALVARSLGPKRLARVEFELFNSFARTYRGHGTDLALVAGMLGLTPDDERVRNSFDLAREAGLEFAFKPMPEEAGVGRHPNTVTCAMFAPDGSSVAVTGESLGGGRVRICQVNGVPVEFTGDYPTLFLSHNDHPGALASITGTLAAAGTNIATINTFRKERGGIAYTIVELDEPITGNALNALRLQPQVRAVSRVEVPGAASVSPDAVLKHDFNSGSQLLETCRGYGMGIGALMRARELDLLGAGERGADADADARMHRVLTAMRAEVSEPLEHPKPSLGGLIGGQGRAVAEGAERLASPLMGAALTRACAYAMAVLERSASMGVIVAAPTAGSSGVVPGALLAVAEEIDASDAQVEEALWCSAAIGAILARNASVAGAEGGCQAEVGSAAAMAAASLVELMGGTPEQALSAASTAISNLLGLVCDPVRGLVEHPCQVRNVIGVSNAISAAQLALSGVIDPLPFDEVVDAMLRVGHALPPSLRETALGGLAAEPAARTARNRCEGCALFA